mmetsp:Transcript_38262/g.46698  ORF Transcript_38262/g.46698 Transcript_38262/m.46698 type:complete len:211 (+) Transcript_38262:167-799(+)|eukprot:CAMPEP_0172512320 /NCGR_PEP_ID=MMETSP1066-20121228/243530_1 /TAXON_ID=671091 /ORGANISM="Coscinodiscus wailesii, Strain CCMP2513" /LENGTH=210 /DNA_ID=CAMNT_0013292073 /DNA_START=167 /DNA_END=799 /DNA_ORIENTATION=+
MVGHRLTTNVARYSSRKLIISRSCLSPLHSQSTTTHHLSGLTTRSRHPTITSINRCFNATSHVSDTASSKSEPDLSKYSPQVVSTFEKIKVLDSVELHLLTELVREKLGFEANPAEFQAGPAQPGASAGTGEAAEEEVEKDTFDLKLTGFDAKSKIKVIKEVRAISGLGLKEAKDMVEGAPKVLKKDLKKEDAEELKKKLEDIGATVELS